VIDFVILILAALTLAALLVIHYNSNAQRDNLLHQNKVLIHKVDQLHHQLDSTNKLLEQLGR
jgi:outer membrane murein-binding lipoprotein Lpp